MSVLDRSLAEIARDIATGEVSSLEVTEAALARAEALQPRINAFIEIRADDARDQARAADRARADGKPLGPLHGVPLAHKDMYYDAGRITRCGSRVRGDFVPEVTSTIVARLRAAGAVTIGTLNMAEFALGATGHNAIWGDCHNPWDTSRIPCGSSSGSGAAVAARIVYASYGSDTGGSTRLPASANGVVGIKPTYGRVSRAAIMPLSPSIDAPGPLARTVADCARILRVTAGHDPADPASSRRPVPDYEAAALEGVAGERIGIPRQHFHDHVTADVRARLDEAVAVLASAGAEIVEVDVPEVARMTELSRVVVYAEAAAIHGAWLRERAELYAPQTRIRASTGLAIPAAAYLEALHARAGVLRRFVESVYSRCDVLLTPTLSIPVPTLEETGVAGGEAMWRILAQLVHCTAPFNYLGLPAISVPIGFTANGMPAGMQLVGRPYAEARLFRVAGAYERETSWHRKAPPLQ